MNNTAENIDCMIGMKRYPDKYFELAIVDPPYGVMNKTKRGTERPFNKGKKAQEWDITPDENYFNELFRVSQNQIIWGYNWLSNLLPPCSEFIFWHKNNPAPSFSDGELAWTSFNLVAKYFRYDYYGNINSENRIHPTQKPVKLYKWLLDKYAKQGDKILDTHLGSGSSRIACYDYGFDFTGFELDKDYFEAQEKRFKDHISQTHLFKNY